MASRSSSDHPESLHPYHVDQSQSTASLELQGKKRSMGGFLGRFLSKSRREALLPLPEGASLSSSSPPSQLLPLSPLQSIDLPHPASMDTTGITVGDSTWAVTYESPPLPPTTILGMPILQHPQPQLAPSEFWDNVTIPLSAYIPAPRDNSLEHQGAPPIWGQPISIADWEQYALEPLSTVEEPVASTSRLPVPESNDSSYWSKCDRAAPRTSSSNSPQGTGHESPDSSGQSHDLHQSYSRPMSCDTMSIPLTRQQEKAPYRNAPVDPTHRTQQSPMREQFPSRPPSRRSRQTTPASTSDDTA